MQITSMLRQASCLLSRSVTSASSKSVTAHTFPTEFPSKIDSTLVESWKRIAPNMGLPKTPSSFMKPRPSTASSIPTKLTVTVDKELIYYSTSLLLNLIVMNFSTSLLSASLLFQNNSKL
ncbi:hypothetical protein Bca4012_074036 [Brassica carinata]